MSNENPMGHLNANPVLATRIQTLSRRAALLVIAVGSLIIVGWLFNIAILKSLLPGLATMKFNTAAGFMLAGSGLLTLRRQPRLTLVAAFIVLLLGLLTLCQYLFGWNLGIDQLLMHDAAGVGQTLYPGRMSPVTALNFCLIGCSLLLTLRSRRTTLAQALALIAAFMGLLSLAGYLYSVQSLYQISLFSSMALHTALTFILVGLALLFANPERGLTATLIAENAGGLLARRLLPAALIIPLLVAWLQLKGQEAGFYDDKFGLAVFAVSNVLVFTLLVYWIARSLNRMDAERSRALEALRHAHEELEGRVQERAGELVQVNQVLEQEVIQRRQVEAVLQQERNLLRTLIDHVPDYIFSKDRAGRFLLSNLAQAQAAHVAAPSDLIGRTAAAFFLPEYLIQPDLDDQAVLQGESIIAQERPSVNGLGQPIWIS
ncbi:MAG: hypothetical protein ABI700_18250, partial [Chloroflexota bacterium]